MSDDAQEFTVVSEHLVHASPFERLNHQIVYPPSQVVYSRIKPTGACHQSQYLILERIVSRRDLESRRGIENWSGHVRRYSARGGGSESCARSVLAPHRAIEHFYAFYPPWYPLPGDRK